MTSETPISASSPVHAKYNYNTIIYKDSTPNGNNHNDKFSQTLVNYI